ncbi:unnamed protein product [Aphanomyces euteiches]|uniref:CASTOR ACT domain-containing protein n=1 Tax=Aphanomyces euteiches TaxID=100861 RepID=A0A6G0WPN1_9STRA|nr:hypothetical protein Ae201684_013077 [Aphanomyces euteiches]KAH9076848.1 hypothetical protein Ae201684P_010779 [Aphanomyces euteiches]KAH9140390.1 hypothetical protein AeRB84_015381 [Aphanomyces euteiches]KAH9142196.1 hypothetical protein AeRB84_013721 [Aphanomyces euteiches]KAH9148305.1 hypothetical protein AeRB84_008296 [Aphanomyces euteiches]
MQRLRLTFFAAPCLSVHRFPKDANVAAKLAPVLIQDLPPLASLTISSDEISLVIPQNVELPVAPSSSEIGWTTFKVEGPLDFALTGILSSLTAPLAAVSIPVFAISTFDTDYILVKHDKAQGAIDAWHASGIASVSTA